MKTFTDKELLYSERARCKCGAGLAYPLDIEEGLKIRAWVCSAVLKGAKADPSEHESFSWSLWKIRSEGNVNGTAGATTRLPGTVHRTIAKATCPKCGHTWESEPYDASVTKHHWRSGPCPNCGLSHGGDGVTDSTRGPHIEWRSRDIVLEMQDSTDSKT